MILDSFFVQRIFHTNQLLKNKALDSCYLLLEAVLTFANRDWLKNYYDFFCKDIISERDTRSS